MSEQLSPILSVKINTSSLPPVFQIPHKKIIKDNNFNLTIHRKINLKPIQSYNNNNNIITFNYMNNSSYANSIFKVKGKPLLKPINMNKNKKLISRNYINESPSEINKYNKYKSLEKFAKTSENYYQNDENMQNQIGKNHISKFEKSKDDKINNKSRNQNKNLIDKNIVLMKNNQNYQNEIYNKNIFTNKTVYLNQKKNYIYSIKEFISINKNKTLMLCIPNLKIYHCIIVPYDNFEKIEEYILQWKKIDNFSIEITSIFDNNEEENYRIIIEKNKNGNLKNLLTTIGNINEYILKIITKQLISIIQFYNKIIKNRFDIFYNIININNICFDYRYNVKLFPGYLYIHSNQINNENNIFKSFFNELNIKEKKNFQLIIDIFNLGFTILNCNLKILNINIGDCLIMNKNNEHKHNEKCCCLFHCIKNNNETFSCLFENINFSQNYFDFLHLITSFDLDNFQIEKIINHSWFNIDVNINNNSKNNINELINLGQLYDFDNEYYTSISNIENFDLLCYYISKKLCDCDEYFSYFSIKNANMIFSTLDIDNLSKELKVYEEDIENKLFKIYNTHFNHNFNTIN